MSEYRVSPLSQRIILGLQLKLFCIRKLTHKKRLITAIRSHFSVVILLKFYTVFCVIEHQIRWRLKAVELDFFM